MCNTFSLWIEKGVSTQTRVTFLGKGKNRISKKRFKVYDLTFKNLRFKDL
jgi:hypothetical protein